MVWLFPVSESELSSSTILCDCCISDEVRTILQHTHTHTHINQLRHGHAQKNTTLPELFSLPAAPVVRLPLLLVLFSLQYILLLYWPCQTSNKRGTCILLLLLYTANAAAVLFICMICTHIYIHI